MEYNKDKVYKGANIGMILYLQRNIIYYDKIFVYVSLYVIPQINLQKQKYSNV